MKKGILKFTVLLLAMMIAFPSWSATTPKREHRSVWITTAWRMCWPTEYGTSTSVATSQKNEAIKYLDLLKENGFNCVYFQVRGMSDAMYKSSYEPWSSYVSGTRGSAPAYDPLEFWVAECHKRGMEIFAWVNPYRYESSVSGASWTGAKDYRTTNPDWIMEYNNASILNPGIKAVQTRIVDVCREIVGNYDVDGLVFDDYFYLNSVPTSYDSDLYKASGSSLSQADWRRENVNSMVRSVYNMIQSTKPYVKFGISPAGVSKTSASKYGISTSSISSASDWQYAQIYSDPLAWLGEGTVDFISPQIYWITTHSTNPYGALSKWWSDACADVFGRHFYSSISISLLEGANTTTNWAELAKQVQCNRDYDGNDAPGSVFFGSRDLTGKRNSGFADYLKQYKFQNIALPPCITWKSNHAYNPGKVSGLTLSGSTLSWNGYNNMRYVVYAVPENTTISGEIPSQYIIGNPYSTTLDVSSYNTGYKLGVSVFDRYGYEYDITWLGGDEEPEDPEEPGTSTELERTTINTPADGSTVQAGFTFGWTANPVSGVSYRLEVATSNTFSNVIFAATTGSTSYSSSAISFTEGTTYYWRVITSKEGYTSSTSWVGSFTIATSGSSTPSTPTDVVKDPSTYNTVNGFSIESLWIYSVNTNNFPSQLGGDQRGIAAYNGKVYISQRDGHLLEFSGETGEFLRSITLTGDCLTDKDGNALQYKCQDLFVDAANNLCISNLTLDCSSVPLTICTIDVNTGATTRVFNMTTTLGGRIDFVAVRGDVNTTGCELWAAVANSNYVYRWTRNASGYWAIAYTSVNTYYPSSMTSNSTAPRIMPISNTQFILDGHNSAPALYTFNASGTATYNDGFGNNTACEPTVNNWNGISQGTVNGTPVFAYVSGMAPNTFTIVTNPSNYSFKQMSKLWTVPANGLGSQANSYVTSKPVLVNNSDGSVTMYIYTPNNGIAAYKLTSSSTVVTPQLDAVSLTTPVGGTTAAKGFSFGWSSISGASYTIEVSKSSSFSSVDFTANTSSNSYSSSNFNLAANTTYYWRVKASKSGYLSSTSSVASFKTAQETLTAVTLTSPVGGAVVEDGFTFKWSAISGATYTLEISSLATFASTMYTLETTTNSYSSSSLDFMEGTKYYWRVKANKSGSIESVSAVESFTTKQTTVTPTPTPDEENKENVEYPIANNLSIKNLWIYSIQKGNFHEELGRDQRGMAAYNGKVYISERANGAGFLLEFDGNSGKFLRKITLTGEYSSLSDGYSLGYPCNDVFVDDGNHLCVANMITSSSASSQLNISIVDVETGNTTRVFETDISNASLRIDNCRAWGDLTKKGAKVFAAPSGNNATSSTYRKRIYCWTRDVDYTTSVNDLYNDWTLGYNSVRNFYPSSSSNFGNAPRVLPISSNRIIVDGSSVYPTLYNYNSSWNGAASTVEDDFSSNSRIKPAGMLSAGMCTASINGRNLYIYSFNDDIAEFHNFAIVNNPSDFSYADMEILWKIPQAGLGNVGNSFVSSIPATQQNPDGSLNLYIYTPSNGLAAYRIDDPTTSVEGVEFNTQLIINAFNKTIHCSEVVNKVEVFTPAGVKVAEKANCKSLNVANLAKGIYLVRATNDGETITETVVIK